MYVILNEVKYLRSFANAQDDIDHNLFTGQPMNTCPPVMPVLAELVPDKSRCSNI